MHSLILIGLTAAFGMPMGSAAPAPALSPIVFDQEEDGVQEMAAGTIKSINATDRSFVVVTGAPGSSTTLRWDDKTVFMFEGKVVKRDEVLKENMHVTVTHKKGLASKVEAINKQP